jgi:small-conductance mechanosensitive channel
MLQALSRFLLLFVLSAAPVTLLADEVTPELSAETQDLNSLGEQLDVIEKALRDAGSEVQLIDHVANQVSGVVQQAQTCLDNYGKEASQTQTAIDSLGAVSQDETPEVKLKRKELASSRQQTEKSLSQCRLISLRANTLLENTHKVRQEILKRQLFAPSGSLVENLASLLQTGRWQAEASSLLGKLPEQLLDGWPQTLVALVYGVAGMLAGLFWNRHKRRQYRQEMPVFHETSPTLAAVLRCLLQVMPHALFAGLAALSLYVQNQNSSPWLQFMLTLLLFSLSYGILHSMLRFTSHIEGIIPLADQHSGRKLQSVARILLLSTLVGVMLHGPALDNISVGDVVSASSLVGLLRILCATLIGFALARLIWLVSGHFVFMRCIRLHLLASVVLGCAVASLWLGYRNFSIFLFSGVFGTLFLLLAAWLLIRIPTEVFDGLDEGRASWQQGFRHYLGLKQAQFVPGLIWLRVANTLFVGGGLVIILLRLWGMPEQNFTLLLHKLDSGFEISGFTLEPLRIINGLLVLSLLVSLTHVFKTYLAEDWLRRTSLSRGAREASTTIVGYIGILVAILLGLAVAGIRFENLAIIAGALSVGIGFGLQNIVNNFVSGLILLFERPIRRGDWIRVGNAEGYVREISIRSTTIQAFDRSDIIVPNSEIISGQVTNMMLNDNYGRIIIPIGVAYGSDTERVMVILRGVAENHPAVLNNKSDMKTRVFFRGFGDNSLDFELRCFIRDIEKRMEVTSDLNLAIDKAFRGQGIDVPFQQRTVHLVHETADHPVKAVQTPAKADELG